VLDGHGARRHDSGWRRRPRATRSGRARAARGRARRRRRGRGRSSRGGPRGPRAPRPARPRVGLAGERADPSRDVDVGRVEHTRRVERREQPVRAQRAPESHGSSVVRSARQPPSVSSGSPASRRGGRRGLDQGDRRLPREDPHGGRRPRGVSGRTCRAGRGRARRRGALRVVARLPPAQVAVQHDGVEQRLQAGSRSGPSPRRARRAGRPRGQRLVGWAEPVGLVVDDRKRGPLGVVTRSTTSIEPVR
jgi:hypothetical protein